MTRESESALLRTLLKHRRLASRWDRHLPREFALDGVEIFLLGLESDVSKIFRPIAERTVLVGSGALYLSNTLGTAREPVQAH
jgi:hypothetical protein